MQPELDNDFSNCLEPAQKAASKIWCYTYEYQDINEWENIIFLDFSRYSSTGVSVYFTLTDFFFIAFQYVSAKFSERILSFSSLVKKFCQFFLTSEAFFPFSSLVKAFSHLK